MSTRHNPARYDPVVKVTPQEAERNKRIMGKSEAAERDPRGMDPYRNDPVEDESSEGDPESNPASAKEKKPDNTSVDK